MHKAKIIETIISTEKGQEYPILDRGASTAPSKETTPSKPELHKDVPSTSMSFLPQYVLMSGFPLPVPSTS